MQIVKQFIITVERREHVPTFSTIDGREVRTGFYMRPLPATQEEVTVTVDFEAIAKALGPRAYHSKHGKSVEAGGLVVVKHTRHKVIPGSLVRV